MRITQLSVFVENKPGRLALPCRLLAQSGINIVTLSLADTQRFGILRLIVRDWTKAKEALERGGFAVNVTEVLAVEVADRPGGLAELLDVIERAGVNVEYMYAFATKLGDKAVLVFRFDKPDEAVKALADSGMNVLSEVELFSRMEGT
ncbi:MAG: ACT domain-containing protein [Thermoguttaceae bacterium]|jgi:hypothetical protein|nr:ACT domain-containing protein [Thermoguttaceae bacterium]